MCVVESSELKSVLKMSTFPFFLVLPVEENSKHHHFSKKDEAQRKISFSEHLICLEQARTFSSP